MVENLTEDRRALELVVEFESDVGDILESRKRRQKKGKVTREVGEQEVVLRYERSDYRRDDSVAARHGARRRGLEALRIALELGARG